VRVALARGAGGPREAQPLRALVLDLPALEQERLRLPVVPVAAGLAEVAPRDVVVHRGELVAGLRAGRGLAPVGAARGLRLAPKF